MPDWLIEGNLSQLILIGVAAAICGYLWTKSRKTLWLGIAATATLFIGMLLLLDRLYESDREQIVGNIQKMCAAVPTRNYDAVFEHFAQDFHYGTFNKADVRRTAESIGKSRKVRDMVVWRENVISKDNAKRRAEVSFQFKIKADGLMEENFFLCKSVWVREPDDDKWRMQSFQVYPLSTADQPLVIPGVG